MPLSSPVNMLKPERIVTPTRAPCFNLRRSFWVQLVIPIRHFNSKRRNRSLVGRNAPKLHRLGLLHTQERTVKNSRYSCPDETVNTDIND